MRIISNSDYRLFVDLREKADGIYSFASAREIKNLEDDIDLPIKNCIAMLALLGCEPTFSCCGFDYQGQPAHKSHQLGFPYIRMKKNTMSIAISTDGLDFGKHGWTFREFHGEILLELLTSMNPHWRNKSCIHYSEECVIGIDWLERKLFTGRGNFKDMVVLKDTNANHRAHLKFWQYPPKKPWTIYKSDYTE